MRHTCKVFLKTSFPVSKYPITHPRFKRYGTSESTQWLSHDESAKNNCKRKYKLCADHSFRPSHAGGWRLIATYLVSKTRNTEVIYTFQSTRVGHLCTMLCSHTLRSVPAVVCWDNEDDLFWLERSILRDNRVGKKTRFHIEIYTLR